MRILANRQTGQNMPAGDAVTDIERLEQGDVVIPPDLHFPLRDQEHRLLSPVWLKPKTKNIGFDPHHGLLQGTTATGEDARAIEDLLRRFSDWALGTVVAMFPHYRPRLQMGMASFRPVEVAGRVSSWRKDDTRLHVDAFPSRPLQGRRIMRVFANIGDSGRHWQTGEPFEDVARRFVPRIPSPHPASLWLREQLRLTRGRRTPYDHYMLGIHDAMKRDNEYQSTARHRDIDFQPGSTWICYTDQVSHAALSGQYALEQTIYLPVSAMQDPRRSPLRVLECILGRQLA